jgi:serine/threonine protein phosphatase PrpC
LSHRSHPRWLGDGASHPGGRSEQQDRWKIFDLPKQGGLLAVVADGMGGHRDGALGAQAIIDATACFVREQAEILHKDPVKALTLLCQRCQDAIKAESDTAHSTVVMLWLYQDRAHWMHVGDSRLYHMRNGRRLVRTRDHSVAQMLMESGEINESEMAFHPDQNRLYRSLGGKEAPKPEIGCAQVMLDDLFVLCSDGVWQHIAEPEFWASACSQEFKGAAASLAGQATVRGGAQADNATLIMIRAVSNNGGCWSWLGRLFKGLENV